jgi:hypothetical protein
MNLVCTGNYEEMRKSPVRVLTNFVVSRNEAVEFYVANTLVEGPCSLSLCSTVNSVEGSLSGFFRSLGLSFASSITMHFKYSGGVLFYHSL